MGKKYAPLQLFFMSLMLCIALVSCVTGSGDSDNTNPPTIPQSQADKTANTQFTYRLFVDNSGSMKNFTPGKSQVTEYPQFLSKFLYHVLPAGKNEFYTFNSRIDTIREKNEDFINNIVAGHLEKGNKGKTELEKILAEIVSTTTNNNITLVVSDFIFDGKDKANKITLTDQIANRIEQKLKSSDITTMVLKCGSKQGSKKTPYYIMIMGNESKVNEMLLYVQNSNLPGFEEYYKYSSPVKKIDAQLINSSECYDIKPPATALVMENAHLGGDKAFKLAININMSSLPYTDSYLEDPASYNAPPGYKIAIAKSKPPFTHHIELQSMHMAKGPIEFGLKTRNTAIGTDNTDMPQLIQTIAEIYKQHYKSDNYFTKTIIIN